MLRPLIGQLTRQWLLWYVAARLKSPFKIPIREKKKTRIITMTLVTRTALKLVLTALVIGLPKYLLVLMLLSMEATLAVAEPVSGEPRPVSEVNSLSLGERRLNPDLLNLSVGRWVKIHEQKPADSVTFRRQAHAGSAFDSRRGRIVVFGSDTHGKDWSNSPLFFDFARLMWSRLYPDDDPNTYRVNSEGIPVAGVEGDHPWAMHTFGALSYDPDQDALIVSSYPAHMKPGRFTDALAGIWSQIRRHPTWKLDLATDQWQPLPGKAVHFFPYATANDPERGVVIGYKASGIFELQLRTGTWRRIERRGLLGWTNNAVYDTRYKTLVVFGSKEKSNDVVIYEPATKRHLKMPTPGQRPPRDRHNPMAFHRGLGQTVVLVDRMRGDKQTRDLRRMQTETWLYDLGEDTWTQVKSATLPFGLGMNYNLEYDGLHHLLLLVGNAPGEAVAVWALRL